MVVNDLDLMGVTGPKLEANPPAPIHRQRPLAGPRPSKFVQTDAFERAQVVERTGSVERKQQVNGGREIQTAKPVRPFTLPDLSAGGVAP